MNMTASYLQGYDCFVEPADEAVYVFDVVRKGLSMRCTPSNDTLYDTLTISSLIYEQHSTILRSSKDEPLGSWFSHQALEAYSIRI